MIIFDYMYILSQSVKVKLGESHLTYDYICVISTTKFIYKNDYLW
jgi:hypothetical protein